MKTIVTAAILTRFSSRVDGAVGFGGVTPELTSIEKCALFELQNKNVRLLIEPVDYAPEAKLIVKADVGIKTPSEQLRSVLFAFYKQESEGKEENEPFDSFYLKHMSKFIEHVKTKLKN